jgi:hypothetical protein
MSIASIGEAVENPSVTQLLAAYPTKEAFDAGVQAGKIKPTTEAGVAANIFNRIVQSALANQAQTQAQTTVFQENTQPMGQKMGLGAIAPGGQPQAPQQMPQGQGLDQVPVPPEMFDEQRMAGGGIVAFQDGGQPPSFAGMYTNLSPDIDALRGVLGAYPTESAEEKARRRREEQAYRLMEIGLGIAGGGSEHFSENLKGALPGLRGAAEDIRAQRKEDVALQMAQRAETGKLLEGVLGTRGKAAEATAAEGRLTKELTSRETVAEEDRKAKITAANIAAGKPTDMRFYADNVVKAKAGDKEAQTIVEGIDKYLQQSALGRNIVAQQGVEVQRGRIDADLYKNAVEYADTAVNKPRSAENNVYRAKLKQDKENAAKGNPTTLAEDFKREIEQNYMDRAPKLSGQAQPGAAPQGAGTKESPLPMPKTAAEAQVGKIYMTARGPARWNGKEFDPVR